MSLWRRFRRMTRTDRFFTVWLVVLVGGLALNVVAALAPR